MSYHTVNKQYNKTYRIVETRQHENGYTLYKIITKEFIASQSLDCITEYFIWKRYNDFKALHGGLFRIHRELYLPGKFPGFIKPKIFGRFDSAVVNERRKCAQELLDFACQHKPLYLSNIFKQFFQGSKRMKENSELNKLKLQPMLPHTEPIKQADSTKASTSHNVLNQSDLQMFDPCLNTTDDSSAEFIQNEWLAVVRDSSKFQKSEEIEIPNPVQKKQKDDNKNSVSDSILNEFLPSTEHVKEENTSDNPDILNSELEDLRISVSDLEMASYHSVSCTLQNEIGRQYNQDVDSIYTKPLTLLPSSGNLISKNDTEDDLNALLPEKSLSELDTNKGDNFIDNSELYGAKLNGDNQNSKEEHRKSSKARAYLNQLLERKRLPSESESNPTKEQEMKPSSLTNTNIKDQQLRSIQKNGSPLSNSTGSQNFNNIRRSSLPDRQSELKTSSLMDLKRFFLDNLDDEERGLYLVDAAHQISAAHNAMSIEQYQTAFSCYKLAINILLQGVQGDTDEFRIQAVRRKTSKYLKKAEEIHENYLKTMLNSSALWKNDQTPSSSANNFDENDFGRKRSSSNDRVAGIRDTNLSPLPLIPSPRHTSKDLLNYKVLGITGKVLLVLDTTSSKAFVIKILRKSTRKSNRIKKAVIPTNVPFMVKLHRFFSTETSIYLVLEHAQGGKLWDNLSNFMTQEAINTDTNTNLTSKQNQTPKPMQLDNLVKTNIEQSTPIKSKTDKAKISENPNNPDMEAIPTDTIDKNKNSEASNAHRTLKSTWSFLSEDDTFVEQELPADDNSSLEIVVTPEQSTTPHLFTIDSVSTISDGENDLQFDISDSSQFKGVSKKNLDSRRMSDDANQIKVTNKPDNEKFESELLSEQDLSAVFCENGRNRTFTDSPSPQSLHPPSGGAISPSLAHLNIGESPSLSVASSMEGDEVIMEQNLGENPDPKNLIPVERKINEHGISTADPSLIFRSVSKCSRSKSTSSFTENLGNAGEDLNSVFEAVNNVDNNAEEKTSSDKTEENSAFKVFENMEKNISRTYRIPESCVKRWGAQLIIAIGTLHSVGILCRNLSPDNILLDANGNIRLTYFGKWKQVELSSSCVPRSNNLYSAPETTSVTLKKTEACDWWSLGALLYELLVGKPLHVQHPSGIGTHSVLHLPDFVSQEAKSLLRDLLQFYPNQRLGNGVRGLDDLMGHPFFTDVNWDKLIDNYSET